MSTFTEYDFAARMRDVIRHIVRDEISRISPAWRYGRVVRINRLSLTADVLFAGDENPITVRMPANVQPRYGDEDSPTGSGNIVRVEGSAGDLWITEVISGTEYGFPVLPVGLFANLSDIANPQNGQLAILTGFGGNTLYRYDSSIPGWVLFPSGFVRTSSDESISGTKTFDTAIRLSSTSDASLSSSDHAFQIGASTGTNLIIDNNEIIARNNGVASTLFLNFDGGTIVIGESAQIQRGGTLWYSVTFQNSWANYGGGYSAVQYRKLPSGLVTLRGLMRNGTVGSPAFTLPTGYRPGDKHIFGTISNGAIGRVDIDTDGTVTPVSPSVTTWVTVSGITFMPTGE